MQVINYSEAEIRRYPAFRGGNAGTNTKRGEYRLIAKSDRGEPDDFELRHNETDEDWNLETFAGSPRHVHDFDQLRFPLKGPMNYAPGKDIPEGAIGYFPAGTHYGPFKVLSPTGGGAYLSMQFGGPSGAGFMSSERLKLAHEALRNSGTFESGYYRYQGDDGRPRSKDAHQAVLEQARGYAVDFPGARYLEPLVILPSGYPWIPAEPGVWTRQLGIFNERGTGVEMLKLEAGASYLEASPGRTTIAFLIKGDVDVEGQHCERNGTVCWRPDESSRIVARDEAEFYVIRLPAFG